MAKIGFEMSEEERVLKVLDTVLDVSIAQLVEGFHNSALLKEENDKLQELLIEANGITSKVLKRCNEN